MVDLATITDPILGKLRGRGQFEQSRARLERLRATMIRVLQAIPPHSNCATVAFSSEEIIEIAIALDAAAKALAASGAPAPVVEAAS